MKNDPLTLLLNLVLAVLVVAAVGFAFLSMTRERDLRQFTMTATTINNNLARANALLNDVAAYNATAKSPELAHIIQAAQGQPAQPAAH